MKFLAAMFSEPGGNPSSMRLMSLVVVVVILGCWAAVTLEKRELQRLGPEEMGLVLGAMGIKAWQRGKEGSNGNGNGNGDMKSVTKQ